MIQIQRPPAPPWAQTLEQNERQRLAGLIGDPPTREPTADELGVAYQDTKEELYLAQHKKCCYCEQQAPFGYNPVEHYRPKLRAKRGIGHPSHGYFWLAWRWNNLLFACSICNSSHKRDLFPLASGSTALTPYQDPDGSERPLLINPSSTDPTRHIKFRQATINGHVDWMPFGLTPEGDKTIDIIKLARPELLDAYRSHAADIRRDVLHLRQVATLNNQPLLIQTWTNLLDQYLRPDRPLLALSRDALEHYLPPAERQQMGLPPIP